MAGFKDPSFDLAYGPSKVGKTTDLLYSFPGAFFIAPPGALKPSVNVVGWDVPVEHTYDAKNVPEATKLIKDMAGKRCRHCGMQFHVVCVDDFSLLTELSFSALEARGLSGWKLWGALADEVLDFRDSMRRVGIHAAMNCHERGPAMVNGLSQRGGPKLPGKLPESLPAGCDMVLRAAPGGATFGGKLGWGSVYRCNPNDPGFVTGDRHGVTPDNAPMNMAEILRAAGYEIPRPEPLRWMDKAVEMISEALWRGGPAGDPANLREATVWLSGQLASQPVYGTPEAQRQNLLGLHLRWVVRDSYDRVVLARARMNPLSLFGM